MGKKTGKATGAAGGGAGGGGGGGDGGGGDIILYTSPDGHKRVEVLFEGETVWLNQKRLADLFGVDVRTVSEHLHNIFASGELQESAVFRKSRNTGPDGKSYLVGFYNLDAIISVGYRVNSLQATQFRIWATRTLREFIIKGFVLDDERLKLNSRFGRDYFDELLARIRDIRASEKRFYQKVRDLFALSSDYKGTEQETHLFFAEVQNKLLYAATERTAAELIVERADPAKPNMALMSWSGSRIRKQDVIIAKNYLSADEIDTLNRLVVIFLEQAELRVKQRSDLTLEFWRSSVDRMLESNDQRVLKGPGKVGHEKMTEIAHERYEAFDAGRRAAEALEADAQDLKQLEQLEKEVKDAKDAKNKGDKKNKTP